MCNLQRLSPTSTYLRRRPFSRFRIVVSSLPTTPSFVNVDVVFCSLHPFPLDADDNKLAARDKLGSTDTPAPQLSIRHIWSAPWEFDVIRRSYARQQLRSGAGKIDKYDVGDIFVVSEEEWCVFFSLPPFSSRSLSRFPSRFTSCRYSDDDMHAITSRHQSLARRLRPANAYPSSPRKSAHPR